MRFLWGRAVVAVEAVDGDAADGGGDDDEL